MATNPLLAFSELNGVRNQGEGSVNPTFHHGAVPLPSSPSEFQSRGSQFSLSREKASIFTLDYGEDGSKANESNPGASDGIFR